MTDKGDIGLSWTPYIYAGAASFPYLFLLHLLLCFCHECWLVIIVVIVCPCRIFLELLHMIEAQLNPNPLQALLHHEETLVYLAFNLLQPNLCHEFHCLDD